MNLVIWRQSTQDWRARQQTCGLTTASPIPSHPTPVNHRTSCCILSVPEERKKKHPSSLPPPFTTARWREGGRQETVTCYNGIGLFLLRHTSNPWNCGIAGEISALSKPPHMVFGAYNVHMMTQHRWHMLKEEEIFDVCIWITPNLMKVGQS